MNTAQLPMNTAPNTPFPDIVIIAADSLPELNAKITLCQHQGYRVTHGPGRFEDVLFDLEAVGKTNVALPKATAAMVILMRNDPA